MDAEKYRVVEGDFIKINKWLLPFSWIYGAAIKLRNILFEMGVLKTRAFQIPIISVGNITIGGTGKTPHVEYLVHLLKDQFRVASSRLTSRRLCRRLATSPTR